MVRDTVAGYCRKCFALRWREHAEGFPEAQTQGPQVSAEQWNFLPFIRE